MGAVVLFSQDMTDAADAFQRGYIGKANSMVPEATDPDMARQSQATDPPVFPRSPTSAGFKLALERILRFGGTFSVPSGPSPYGGRLRARTGIAERPGPAVVQRNIDPRTPAGLVPVDPWYESYLTADGGYIS